MWKQGRISGSLGRACILGGVAGAAAKNGGRPVFHRPSSTRELRVGQPRAAGSPRDPPAQSFAGAAYPMRSRQPAPVVMEPGGGCHRDRRARTSQSVRSCGASSPLGWRRQAGRGPCAGAAGVRAAGQKDCTAASPKAPLPSRTFNHSTAPAPRVVPTLRLSPTQLRRDAALGRPSLRLAPNPFPVKEGMLRERRGRAPREEGAAGSGGGPRPPRSAVPGAPAHAHSGRPAGGAALTSPTDPPHPLVEGRWPRRLRGTDSQTDPGRRDGRTARPCPGRLLAPSCCCLRRAARVPAQVRLQRSPACVRPRRPAPSACLSPLRACSLRPLPGPFGALNPLHLNPDRPSPVPTQRCGEGQGGAGMSSRSREACERPRLRALRALRPRPARWAAAPHCPRRALGRAGLGGSGPEAAGSQLHLSL